MINGESSSQGLTRRKRPRNARVDTDAQPAAAAGGAQAPGTAGAGAPAGAGGGQESRPAANAAPGAVPAGRTSLCRLPNS